MTMVKDRKFQVGDIVVPVGNRYGITNKENNCVCEVIDVTGDRFMIVKVIEIDDYNHIGNYFPVSYDEFVKITSLINLLKQGQHVVLENGETYLVLENMTSRILGEQKFVFVNKNRFLSIHHYDDNLKIKSRDLERFSVDKIMSFNDTNNINTDILNLGLYENIVWERKKESNNVVIVYAKHFGSDKTYEWINTKDKKHLEDLSIGDILEVETRYGIKMVEIVDINQEYKTDEEIDNYKKVVRRIRCAD